MSDFCSPLLTVMQNEVDTFWCFVGVMNKVVSIDWIFLMMNWSFLCALLESSSEVRFFKHANFEKDQTAIKVQLNQLRDILMIINPKLANYLGSFGILPNHGGKIWWMGCFQKAMSQTTCTSASDGLSFGSNANSPSRTLASCGRLAGRSLSFPQGPF